MAVRRKDEDAKTHILSRASGFATEELQKSARGVCNSLVARPSCALQPRGCRGLRKPGRRRLHEGCTNLAGLRVTQARLAKVAQAIQRNPD